MPNETEEKDRKLCIEVCLRCAEACLACAEQPGENRTLQLDCEAICRLTAAVLERSSPQHPRFCALCAQICRECAAACAPHAAHDERCQVCENACVACADECARHAVEPTPAA